MIKNKDTKNIDYLVSGVTFATEVIFSLTYVIYK